MSRPSRRPSRRRLPPAPPPLSPELLDDWATALTAVTLPGSQLPFGSSTITCSPTVASLCRLASRSTVTTSCVEVVCRISDADPPPPEPLEPLDPLDPPEPDESPECDAFDPPLLPVPWLEELW